MLKMNASLAKVINTWKNSLVDLVIIHVLLAMVKKLINVVLVKLVIICITTIVKPVIVIALLVVVINIA